ncbi:MAG TPA: hypothetical protein VFI83_08700 [Gaiella sp.]|jgi:hypothetical protein|nr:hypothetical protein [Gaiella sp.]
MDIDSSANINWLGAFLNRPDYQRLIPTGIIAVRSVARRPERMSGTRAWS